uniref:Reverse transcriptase domain-containing protein n=1 Tax=Caenorhabditis tropicalis TaxID=1561998 RepID=A0A1I7UAF4_9PELO
MSAAWNMVIPSEADEASLDREVTYACSYLDLGNGLHREIRFTAGNTDSVRDTSTYPTYYMLQNLPKPVIIKLADDMIVKRMEFLQDIYNGYASSRGKFDYKFALALMDEYLSEEVLINEFEYQNFSGQNQWNKPKILDDEQKETPFHKVTQSRRELNSDSTVPSYHWLFSNKPCDSKRMGRLESLYRSRQQRILFGGDFPKPKGWDFDKWLDRFVERTGEKQLVEENKPTSKELICSFIGQVSFDSYREYRVRYTNEMMSMEFPEYSILLDELLAMIRARAEKSSFKLEWTTIKEAVNENNAKFLYAMFKQGINAVWRFEAENMYAALTDWNEPKPLASFFKFFNKTIHYETTTPAPAAVKTDPITGQTGIDFMNKFKENGNNESKGPAFDSRPFTEDELYSADSSNGSEIVPIQAETKSEVASPEEKNSKKEEGLPKNESAAKSDCAPKSLQEENKDVATVVSEVKLTLSYAKIVGKSAKQETEVSKPVPQECKPKVVETVSKPAETQPTKQENHNQNDSNKKQYQKSAAKPNNGSAKGWKQVETNFTYSAHQNRKKSNDSIKINGSSVLQDKKQTDAHVQNEKKLNGSVKANGSSVTQTTIKMNGSSAFQEKINTDANSQNKKKSNEGVKMNGSSVSQMASKTDTKIQNKKKSDESVKMNGSVIPQETIKMNGSSVPKETNNSDTNAQNKAPSKENIKMNGSVGSKETSDTDSHVQSRRNSNESVTTNSSSASQRKDNSDTENKKKSNGDNKANGSSAPQPKKPTKNERKTNPESKKETSVAEPSKPKSDVGKSSNTTISKETDDSKNKPASSKDEENQEIIPCKSDEAAEKSLEVKKEEKTLPETQNHLKKANEEVAGDLETAQPAIPEPPKETKAERRKARKAAEKAAKTLIELKDSVPAGLHSTEMLAKLLMTDDDGSYVEAEFDVQVTSSKSKNKKKKKKQQQKTDGKETTTVEASFSDHSATVFVNNALIAAQNLYRPTNQIVTSHIHYLPRNNSGEENDDEYVPGQKVTHDYRPGARSHDGDSDELESDTNSSNQPESSSSVRPKQMESKGCSAGNDEYDEVEIGPTDESSELEVEMADPVAATFVERACDPELHDMFRRMKQLADKKSQGGLRNLEHNRRKMVQIRLQRFLNVYLFRMRVAKSMLFIMDIDTAADLTGERERTVIKGLMAYIQEHVETEPNSIRGRKFDELVKNITLNGASESDMISKGLRFIDLRVTELHESEPLQQDYKKICDRVFKLMEDQQVLYKIVANCVDFRGYEEHV